MRISASDAGVGKGLYLMLLVLFAFWLLLNGQWTGEIAVTGAVICTVLWLFMWRFMGYSPRMEWRLLKKVPRGLAYMGWLVGEIVRSALAVIRLIWSPSLEPQPKLVQVDSSLRTERGRVLLADSITLTPGTVTVAVDGNRLLVHALDESMAEGLNGSDMERRIARVEGRKKDA